MSSTNWINIFGIIPDWISAITGFATLCIAIKVYRSLPEWLSKSSHEEVKNFFKIMTSVNTELCNYVRTTGYKQGRIALWVPLFYPADNQIAVIKCFLCDKDQDELWKRYNEFKACSLQVWIDANDERKDSNEIDNKITEFYRYLTRLKFSSHL